MLSGGAVRYSDLSAKDRKAVDAALGSPKSSPRRSQRAVPVKGGRWRCVACGNTETTLTATEKHSDQARHHRYEICFDGATQGHANAIASAAILDGGTEKLDGE